VGYDLDGYIPRTISHLEYLKVLNISVNKKLKSNIPSSLGNLFHLRNIPESLGR
jgi:hypothetical protein